jgi:hypothetical protein
MAERAGDWLYRSDKPSQPHTGASTTPPVSGATALESGKGLFFPGMQEIGDTPKAPLGRTPTILIASRKPTIPVPLEVVHDLPCIDTIIFAVTTLLQLSSKITFSHFSGECRRR